MYMSINIYTHIYIHTESAKFMATHILTWFSNKNEEN